MSKGYRRRLVRSRGRRGSKIERRVHSCAEARALSGILSENFDSVRQGLGCACSCRG